jgi:hypothetical protein
MQKKKPRLRACVFAVWEDISQTHTDVAPCEPRQKCVSKCLRAARECTRHIPTWSCRVRAEAAVHRLYSSQARPR